MEARTLLAGGIGLTVAGALLLVAGGQEQGVRSVASLLAVLGLLALAMSVWALTARPAGALLVGGAALFILGRLALIFLPFEPSLFSGLTVVNALGTVLLFVGVWQAVRDRLATTREAQPAPPARPATSPRAAPRPSPVPAAPRSSIRPAQPLRSGSTPPKPPKP